MNCYAWLSDFKTRIDVTGTASDTALLTLLIQASRMVDQHCRRHFFIEDGQTRYFDASGDGQRFYFDDYLNITSFQADSEDDGTYDGETWVDETDFWQVPSNGLPKFGIEEHQSGNFSLTTTKSRFYKVVADFGYGDGKTTTPYKASGETVASINDSATTMTVSDGDKFQVGMTVRVESEQMFVEAITTHDLTVVRGVNNTTAAAHTAQAVSIYQYPENVRLSTLYLAELSYKSENSAGLKSEKIGDYAYTKQGAGGGTQALLEAVPSTGQLNAMLGHFIKAVG